MVWQKWSTNPRI